MQVSGLSQAGFARALGTSASRLSTYLSGGTVPSASWYLRAMRLGEALGQARDRSWMTPILAAGEIRHAVAAGERVWALRMILQCRDHLRAAFELADGGAEVASAWEAAPEPVGVEEWDRLLASVIGHEFDLRGWPAPAWTATAGTPAGGDRWWLFGSPFFTETEVRAATPGWLAERGIFIAERDLITA
jgi:hypothetical protein